MASSSGATKPSVASKRSSTLKERSRDGRSNGSTSIEKTTHTAEKRAAADVSLQTEMFEFYDQVLREAERFADSISHKATAAKAKEELKMSHIAIGCRDTTSPHVFAVKAKRITAFLQKMELQHHAARPSTNEQIKTTTRNEEQRIQSSTRLSPAPRQHRTIVLDTGVGNAIPLCLPNDSEWDPRTHKVTYLKDVTRNSLVLIPDAINILKSISGPVCVVAIVGPCRSGKSYILSRLISNKGPKCHFDLGHEMDPKTMGIWMWDRPYKMRLRDGTEATMIFLDTEGIDAANATEQGDNQIFTLSVLLSSLLIYNSMHVPKRDDLSQMNYIANLSKSIQVQTGKSADEEGKVKLYDCNPHFVWLLRDVTLMPTDKHGQKCHIKDYLLQKVLSEDMAGSEVQRNTRRCLLSFFSSFDSETLPPPSTNPAVMSNIENPAYYKEINPAFRKKSEIVISRIMLNYCAKRGFTEGSLVSGSQLAHLVELYVAALNEPGGVPVVGSTWQRVLEATYTDGLEKAVVCYKKRMDEKMKRMPMTNDDLFAHHQGAVRKCLESFQQAVTLDSESQLYQKYLDELMARLAIYNKQGDCTDGYLARYLHENYSKSRSLCQSLVEQLKEKHLDPLINQLSPATDFRDIEAAFAAVVTSYDERSVGPAADDVLEHFIQEEEKERVRLKQQLKAIKNYDEEAVESRRIAREKEQYAEKKERERLELEQKMLQAHKDNEAKLEAVKDKFKKDAEDLKKDSLARLKDQEKRLKDMSDAKLNELRKENIEAHEKVKRDLAAKELQLRNSNASLESQLSQQRNEIQQLRQQLSQKQRRKGKCFVAGTKVTCTDGSELVIEKQTDGVKLLAIGGETTTITQEYVRERMEAGEKLFGINDDTPFAALPHPFWTTDGWKSLDPEFAKQENPNIDFKLLQVGDVVFRIAQINPLLYEPVKIRQFTFTTLEQPIMVYGLHLDGPRSYHANGYVVAANYPVLTKKRVSDGLKKLTEEEKERLISSMTTAQSELSKVLGSWADHAFKDMGLVSKDLSQADGYCDCI